MAKRAIFLAVAVLTVVASVSVPSPAAAATSGDFVASINSLRSSKGLGGLATNANLTSVAQSWSASMAAKGAISHSASLGSAVSGNWTKVGENVGVGHDVAGLMKAFINSPGHYRNLVDPAFNSVGVGVTVGGDGRMYTAHVFAAFPGAPAPKAAAPAPKPAAAPKAVVAPKPTAAPKPVKAKAAPANPPAASASVPQPEPAAPAEPVGPPPPQPSPRIVQGFVEVGSIFTQG